MGDDWLAVDKVKHVAACFFVTTVVAFLCGLVRRLRRWRVQLGAMAGLVVGGLKEAGDATGLLWPTSGASWKDGVADVVGVALGVVLNLLVILLYSLRHQVRNVTKAADEQV